MAKNDNLYQIYNDRLSMSHKKFKTDMEDNIKKWRRYYKGDHWTDASKRQYKFTSVDNMVFSNIKTIMPSINFNNPAIYVQAKKKPYRIENGIFDTIAASAIFEIMINYYFCDLEVKREVDKCLLDSLIGPWGIMQIGYSAETEKVDGDELIEVNELIKSDSPFVKRVSPLNFRVDAGATDSHLNDARWCAVKWTKTSNEVKANPYYKNTGELKPNAHVGNESDGDSAKDEYLDSAHDFSRIEGWDIWDKEKRKLITIVPGYQKLLQNREWPLDLGGFPFETLYFNESPDEIWPISDTQVITPAQDELNRMRSLQLTHIKNISQRKYVARENAFDQEELDKLADGPDGTIAVSKQAADTAIVPLKDANISQDFYLAINTIKNNIREMGGTAQFERGLAQKFDTAKEPELMAQGLTIQRAERSAILEDFIIRVVQKLGRTIQQTLGEREFQLTQSQFDLAQRFVPSKLEKIAGESATVILPWLKAGKDSIQGEYEFAMDVGSTQPINSERRRQDALSMAKIFQGDPYLDPIESRKRILDAFDVKDQEKLLRNPQQVQQEMAQAKQAEQQQPIMERQMKNEADLAKTKMKSETTLLTTLLKREKGNAGI